MLFGVDLIQLVEFFGVVGQKGLGISERLDGSHVADRIAHQRSEEFLGLLRLGSKLHDDLHVDGANHSYQRTKG